MNSETAPSRLGSLDEFGASRRSASDRLMSGDRSLGQRHFSPPASAPPVETERTSRLASPPQTAQRPFEDFRPTAEYPRIPLGEFIFDTLLAGDDELVGDGEDVASDPAEPRGSGIGSASAGRATPPSSNNLTPQMAPSIPPLAGPRVDRPPSTPDALPNRDTPQLPQFSNVPTPSPTPTDPSRDDGPTETPLEDYAIQEGGTTAKADEADAPREPSPPREPAGRPEEARDEEKERPSRHAPNTPVLHTVHRLESRSGDQLFVQGAMDAADSTITYVGVQGWTHVESGGGISSAGSVNFEDGNLVLREGDSFEVYAETKVVIPAGASKLAFDYIATFDSVGANRINDAFEAALLDDAGNTLVPTIGFGRDSFFNFTEQQLLGKLGAGTEHSASTPPSDATVAGTVELDVSHLAGSPTPRTLVVRLVNNDGDTGTTVSILGNHAPLALDDAYSVNEDVVLSVNTATGVLLNDTDADLDNLESQLVQGPGYGPFYGQVTLNSDGSFTYTPDLDSNGNDTFTYRAWDGLEYSTEATVTITVNPVNDAPVAVDDTYGVNEDTVLTIGAGGLLANDTDVEDDPLTVTKLTDPANGIVTLSTDGSLSYILLGKCRFRLAIPTATRSLTPSIA